MDWINKRLQINEGSYGVLNIDAKVHNNHYPTQFDLKTYSHINAGGRHEHHNFSLETRDAIKFANALLQPPKEVITFKQKYSSRGKLFLEKENGKLVLSIGSYANSSFSGIVNLNRAQAKKLAGYVFFWIGQHLIGQKKVVIPKSIEKELDINDG